MKQRISATLAWKSGMTFVGETGGHSLTMDAKAPIGKDEGLTPKELVALGTAGCTAMDVAALMKKYKQEVLAFKVHVQTESTETHPVRFQKMEILFEMEGPVDAEKFKEAVQLSQTKYCGVSAMIAATCPITYKLHLNGQLIHEGAAAFSL